MAKGMKEQPHVLQAREELANAQAIGQPGRAAAARKVLAAAGVDVEDAGKARAATAQEQGEPERVRRTPPRGRAPARRETTGDSDDTAAGDGEQKPARGPEGRATPAKSHTRA